MEMDAPSDAEVAFTNQIPLSKHQKFESFSSAKND
jgi:hypothetical protein